MAATLSHVLKRILNEEDVLESSPSPKKSRLDSDDDDKEEVFKAFEVPALCGKHPAMLYRTTFPSDLCYPFMFKRANKKGTNIYICSSCKKMGKELKAIIVDGQFTENPASLAHICMPKIWADEVAKRWIYRTTQNVKAAQEPTTVQDIYNRLMDEILQDASLKVNDRLAIFSSVGRLKSHRRSFSRAIQGRVSSSPEQKPSLLTSPSAL